MIRFFHKIRHLLLLLVFCLATQSAAALVLLRDAEVEAILQELASPLLTATTGNAREIKVLLYDDDNPNAFVADYRYIYVSSGLLAQYDHPEPLLAVLAHELGHMSLGHLSKRQDFIKAETVSNVLIALTGVGVGMMIGSPEVMIASSTFSNTYAQAEIAGFSRLQESEADKYALNLLHSLEAPGTGLAELFTTLGDRERLHTKGHFSYLATHPLTQERKYYAEQNKFSHPAYFSADFRARFSRVVKKLLIFKKQIKAQDIDTPYLRAVQLTYQLKSKEALRVLNEHLSMYEKDAFYLELMAKNYFSIGDFVNSQRFFERALTVTTHSPMLKGEYAITLIHSNMKLDKAKAILTALLYKEPENELLWHYLGVVLERQGKAADGFVCYGLSHAYGGNKEYAQKFYDKAAKMKFNEDNSYERLSILEGLLKKKKKK